MNISGIKLKIASKKVASRAQDLAISEEVGLVESAVVVLDTMEDGVVKSFRGLKESLHLKDENFKLIFSVASKVKKQDSESICFNPADISWTGDFKGELKEIGGRRFDLLVCFTKEHNKAAKFISAALNAELKVSRENSGSPVFDLSISTRPDEPEIFTEELKKYLRILNRIKE